MFRKPFNSIANDKETYENKYHDLTDKISTLSDSKAKLKDTASREINVKKRIADFRRVLENNEVLTEFDRYVFESIIDKVIIGGVDNDGNKDPYMLTFIYKTGFTIALAVTTINQSARTVRTKTRQINCVLIPQVRSIVYVPILLTSHVETVVLLHSQRR